VRLGNRGGAAAAPVRTGREVGGGPDRWDPPVSGSGRQWAGAGGAAAGAQVLLGRGLGRAGRGGGAGRGWAAAGPGEGSPFYSFSFFLNFLAPKQSKTSTSK